MEVPNPRLSSSFGGVVLGSPTELIMRGETLRRFSWERARFTVLTRACVMVIFPLLGVRDGPQHVRILNNQYVMLPMKGTMAIGQRKKRRLNMKPRAARAAWTAWPFSTSKILVQMLWMVAKSLRRNEARGNPSRLLCMLGNRNRNQGF